MNERIKAAMFAKDTEALMAMAPCRCCCAEHGFTSCPANAWGGCRYEARPEDDFESWVRVYAAIGRRI